MLKSLFGGGSDVYNEAAKQAGKAGDKYSEYATKERDAYTQYQQQAKGDIDKYLQQGLSYTDAYRKAGENALNVYQESMGLKGQQGYSDVMQMFHESPGYQFALEQGQKSINASAAAGGGALSGGVLKELTKYGQGMADQEYGNWQNRLQGMTELGAKMSSQAESDTVGVGTAIGGYDVQTGKEVGGSYQNEGAVQANAMLEAAKLKAQGAMADQASARGLIGDLAKVGGFIAGGPIGSAIGSWMTGGSGSGSSSGGGGGMSDNGILNFM
jgi:hypothetical protein